MIVNRITRLLATALVTLAAGAVTALPASATIGHATHHPRHHHHRRRGIPQHNGGDRDPDNNGHPSDGDGDI